MKYWQPYGISNTDAPYINGDPSIGRQGSIPPAGAFEQPMRELVNLIKASNYEPNELDTSQVAQSVRSQRMNYAVVKAGLGGPNQLHVAFNPSIGSNTQAGMPLRIKALYNNTLPCSLVVDGVENPIRRSDGAELQANDLVVNAVFEVIWCDTGYWSMTNYRGGGTSLTEEGDIISNTYLTKIPYTVDLGTPNALVAQFSPPLSLPIVAGDAIEVKLTNNITGAATLQADGLPAQALRRPDGSPTQVGDAYANQVALFLRRDDNTWQFEAIMPQAFTGMGLPVGCIILTPSVNPFPGTLKLNGQGVGIAQYPGLWQFAYYSGRIVGDSQWTDWNSRLWTCFSYGDGATWFRLPDLRGEFMRFWDDSRGVDPGRQMYYQQPDGIGPFDASGAATLVNPIATGYISQPTGLQIWDQGALARSTWVASISGGGSGESGYVTGQPGGAMTFGSSTYGSYEYSTITGQLYLDIAAGNETRPRNTALQPCIVAG